MENNTKHSPAAGRLRPRCAQKLPLRAASPGARPSRLGVSTFRARLPARPSLPVAPRPQLPPPRGISAPPARAVSGHLQQRSPGSGGAGSAPAEAVQLGDAGTRSPPAPPASPFLLIRPFFPSFRPLSSPRPQTHVPLLFSVPRPRCRRLGAGAPFVLSPAPGGKCARLSAKFPAPPDAAPDSAQQPVTSLRLAHAIGSLWALGGRT